MRKFGLADALGIIASLVALAWLPGSLDPLTYPKLLVLVAGGLALAPAALLRWKQAKWPSWPFVIPLAAATLLIVWGATSTVASGAPVWNSLFGWWGRGDGLLAWLGALFLLLGAASLSIREVARTITWLLVGATLVSGIGMLQVVGVNIPEGVGGGAVVATMGNTNFAAGYFAILASFALGRALTRVAVWQRVWAGLLFITLVFLAIKTQAVQGPAALTTGVVALGVSYALLYRGRFRVFGLSAAAIVVALGATTIVASFFQVGPLAGLWSDRTFDIRKQYWQAAIRIMNGLPIHGTGPDGFSRYVAEYRPESYVELLGPVLRVSAAHNVALQYGAVIGYVGLVLWVVLFVSVGLLLLVRIVRKPVAVIGLTASIVGSFAAYFVQGMVSIDMLPLLATGWLVAGLAIAAARESVTESVSDTREAPRARRAKPESVMRNRRPFDKPSASVWVSVTGGILAIAAALLVGAQMLQVNEVRAISTQEQALAFIANPLTPCVLRVQVTQQILQQVPPDVAGPAILRATELDPRCPPMIAFASEVLLQQKDSARAGISTLEGVTIDPLFDTAWALRARYYLSVGDLSNAEAALAEAQRVQALYPAGSGDPSLIQALLTEIQSVK